MKAFERAERELKRFCRTGAQPSPPANEFLRHTEAGVDLLTEYGARTCKLCQALVRRTGTRGRFPEFCGRRCRDDHRNAVKRLDRKRDRVKRYKPWTSKSVFVPGEGKNKKFECARLASEVAKLEIGGGRVIGGSLGGVARDFRETDRTLTRLRQQFGLYTGATKADRNWAISTRDRDRRVLYQEDEADALTSAASRLIKASEAEMTGEIEAENERLRRALADHLALEQYLAVYFAEVAEVAERLQPLVDAFPRISTAA